MLSDQEEEYFNTNNKHDKIFRTLLDKKEDAAEMINKAIKTQLKAQDIEKYNSSFVNKIFQNREADVVYKLKNRNIFFLIEHQTKIDYSMPYRILEYEVAIIENAIDLSKIKNKGYKIPLVIPIVLYTGNKKWNARKYLKECQEEFKEIKVSLGNYNLIDINDFTEEELLNDKTFISKMMLIEKGKDTNEIIEILNKVIKSTKDENKEMLKRIIFIALEEKLGYKETMEVIDKIDGGEEEMLAIVDTIRRENQMYINMGRKEAKKEAKKEIKNKLYKIAQKLLERNTSKEDVAEITGLKEKEIEKVLKMEKIL
mgnify:CR=1 FL=1